MLSKTLFKKLKTRLLSRLIHLFAIEYSFFFIRLFRIL